MMNSTLYATVTHLRNAAWDESRDEPEEDSPEGES